MWQWLRRTFVTGFFVTVPLVVSVVAIVWVFHLSDRLMGGLPERWLGRPAPEVSLAVTLAIVLAAGAVARNVLGRRILQRGEGLLMHIPVFRTVYGPIKQLVAAFSPDNEGGFKRAVLVDEGPRGFVLGFVTKEFTIDRGQGPERLLAVYVPTNQLYLGHVMICAPDRVSYPDLTVEQAIRAFLTGGMGLPGTVHSAADSSVFRGGSKPLD
jgi:uncharacterized membrane protein